MNLLSSALNYIPDDLLYYAYRRLSLCICFVLPLNQFKFFGNVFQAVILVSCGSLNATFFRFLTSIYHTVIVLLKLSEISPSPGFFVYEVHAVSELVINLHTKSSVVFVVGVLTLFRVR